MDAHLRSVLALAGLLLPTLVLAQAPLTLEQAIAQALRANEQPQIARARRDRAAAQGREAWARLLPQATVQGQYTRRQRAVEREVGGETAVIQSRNALGASANLSVSVLDAPAIPLVLRARRLESATAHEAEGLIQTLSYDVAAAFYAVLSAEEILAAAERRVSVSEAGLIVAQRRLQAGLVGKQEVTRTALAVSTARQARTDAALLRATSRLALGELLAMPADMPLTAPELPPEPVRQSSIAARPDLRLLEEQLKAAELFALEPWLRLIPSISVGATYRLTNEPGLSGLPADWNAVALASWTLYDGGLRYAQARGREAEARELRFRLSALERTANREFEEAVLRLEAAREAVTEARTTTRLAQENAGEVERLFEAGLATALERDDATVAAFEADAELAQKTFAARVARLEQRRAHGLWPLTEGAPPEAPTQRLEAPR